MDPALDKDPVIAPATDAAIARAAALLKAVDTVGMPTETVYGLAADACNDQAVARIFELKERPRFNPLIIHCAGLDLAAALVAFSPMARKLAEAFWPGPLTLVLPRQADCPVSLLASAGLDTLAVRVPAHPVAQALLKAYGSPVAAPSANPSGKLSPTTAEAVADALPLPLVLDGGPCDVGLESTILGLSDETVTLLRPGGVAVEEIENVLGKSIKARPTSSSVSAPGQLASHYAPTASLRLNAGDKHADESFLAYGPVPDGVVADANLSPSGNLREAAANLFRMLRDLDAPGTRTIAVMPVPEAGLGVAINDRLHRAAAPRDSHEPG